MKIIIGDNLAVMRGMSSDSVDLIYLDPPFNTGRDFGEFDDRWADGEGLIGDVAFALKHSQAMANYLSFMEPRLFEMKRLLKDTGSIYLHCDSTASHYIKVMVDGIFGHDNFRSEIVWRRTGSHGSPRRWGPVHDTILFYSVTDQHTWNWPKQPYMRGHVDDNFVKDDGGYRTNYYGNVLTGSGIRGGLSGKPWRGIDPTPKNRHWAIPGKLWEESGLSDEGLDQHEKLDALFDAGLVTIEPGSVWPSYGRRIRPDDGPATNDIWAYQPYTEGAVFGTEDGIDSDVSWIKPRSATRNPPIHMSFLRSLPMQDPRRSILRSPLHSQ